MSPLTPAADNAQRFVVEPSSSGIASQRPSGEGSAWKLTAQSSSFQIQTRVNEQSQVVVSLEQLRNRAANFNAV